MKRVIEVAGLAVERAGRSVLAGIDFHLDEGERLLIDGASGAGKSTLLHALLGFVERRGGRISLLGQPCGSEREFAALRGPVGLLFQDPDDQLIGPTVFEDVEFGPLNLGLDPHDAHRGRTRAWSASASPIWPSGRCTNCLAAKSVWRRWRGCWRCSRPSCCWTNPRPGSMPPRPSAWWRHCARSSCR
jgi:ABC-type phosphate transport system ATPase subunit